MYLAATTLIAVLICFAWFMSPLGSGFATWTNDPGQRQAVLRRFQINYHLGLPMLIVAQLVSAYLATRDMRKLVFLLPAASIGAFCIPVRMFLAPQREV